MTDPDLLDDTAADHEQLKNELLAQDRDTVRVSTADVDERTARQLVSALVDDGVVTAVAASDIARLTITSEPGQVDEGSSCSNSWTRYIPPLAPCFVSPHR